MTAKSRARAAGEVAATLAGGARPLPKRFAVEPSSSAVRTPSSSDLVSLQLLFLALSYQLNLRFSAHPHRQRADQLCFELTLNSHLILSPNGDAEWTNVSLKLKAQIEVLI